MYTLNRLHPTREQLLVLTKTHLHTVRLAAVEVIEIGSIGHDTPIFSLIILCNRGNGISS